MRRTFLLHTGLAGIVTLTLLGGSASAQRGGGGGGQNDLTSLLNSFGGSGGASGGGSTGSGSSLFSSGSGSAFGNSAGRGGTGGAAGAAGLATQAGQSGLGGLLQQNQGFIGRNNDPNAFIGRSAQGQMSGQSSGGRSQFGSRGGGGRSLDQGLMNLMNGGQAVGTSQQPTIRPRLQAAFDYPPAPVNQVISETQVRFQKLATRYPELEAVQLELEDGGTVILSGNVDSPRAAKLAENLVRLEPGVRQVRNELSYPPPAPQ